MRRSSTAAVVLLATTALLLAGGEGKPTNHVSISSKRMKISLLQNARGIMFQSWMTTPWKKLTVAARVWPEI